MVLGFCWHILLIMLAVLVIVVGVIFGICCVGISGVGRSLQLHPTAF